MIDSRFMTDIELISRIRSREPSAFDLFYDRYAQIIFNLCIRILRDEVEAEDVMQEVFIQIWKEAERFDAARASVKTWIFTIARSRSLDRYRSRKTAQQRLQENASEELNHISSKEDLQNRRVLQNYVAHAVDQLSREQRIVLELSYYRGLTQEEIAELLGEPLGTIKSRIRSALIRLRSLFSGEKSNG
jgi:RNA polymerase sigma-70 factor, ECF subfamily